MLVFGNQKAGISLTILQGIIMRPKRLRRLDIYDIALNMGTSIQYLQSTYIHATTLMKADDITKGQAYTKCLMREEKRDAAVNAIDAALNEGKEKQKNSDIGGVVGLFACCWGNSLYNGERIGRTSGTMTTTTTSFAEITDAVDKVKASATEAPKHKLPISADDKTTILLNVEGAIKDLIFTAKKNPIKGTSIGAEELGHLPNSLTGGGALPGEGTER